MHVFKITQGMAHVPNAWQHVPFPKRHGQPTPRGPLTVPMSTSDGKLPDERAAPLAASEATALPSKMSSPHDTFVAPPITTTSPCNSFTTRRARMNERLGGRMIVIWDGRREGAENVAGWLVSNPLMIETKTCRGPKYLSRRDAGRERESNAVAPVQ